MAENQRHGTKDVPCILDPLFDQGIFPLHNISWGSFTFSMYRLSLGKLGVLPSLRLLSKSGGCRPLLVFLRRTLGIGWRYLANSVTVWNCVDRSSAYTRKEVHLAGECGPRPSEQHRSQVKSSKYLLYITRHKVLSQAGRGRTH